MREVITSVPKLNAVDVPIVLGDLYEMRYGIYPHGQKPKPFASSAFHPAYVNPADKRLEELLKMYRSNKIGEIWKLSLKEYLSLPPNVIGMINKISIQELASKNTSASDAEKLLKDALKGSTK